MAATTSSKKKSAAAFDLNGFLASRTESVNAALDRFLPSEKTKPATIHKAMRYSLFAGGKRMRPAVLLAAAGLLDGCRATTHWAFLSCFSQRFPKVIVAPGHPRFVHDRDRLTAGGVASGLDAALKLIELLGGTALAQQVQQDTQYYPDPPVHSMIPPTPAECPIPASIR